MAKENVTKKTLQQLKGQGLSTRKIAKQVGKSQTWVVKTLNGPDEKKPVFLKPRPSKAQLQERVKWGWTQAQIAQEFNLSQSEISKEMSKHGVKPNHYTSTGRSGGSNAQVRCTCHVKPGKKHKSDCDMRNAARNK